MFDEKNRSYLYTYTLIYTMSQDLHGRVTYIEREELNRAGITGRKPA